MIIITNVLQSVPTVPGRAGDDYLVAGVDVDVDVCIVYS